jgi:cytochrome oxidase Cu insertion factor (SCO1/SenC/PrrC family)
MGGMGPGLPTNDPTIVSAFNAALIHEGLIILAIIALLGAVWIVVQEGGIAGRQASTGAPAGRGGAERDPEPMARRLLRIGFGVLWVIDGLLQAQPAMPVGLPSQVLQPAADSSPAWVQHLVNWGVNAWAYHPITAAASAVWIQLGIGLWLLVAARGIWSRLAGLASAGWGLVVWVFGEAFGGVFGHGLTVLFGAPGAVLFYVVAGALVALPLRAWSTPRLGRLLLAGMGLFLLGMAVLQAWPGRGFWQGTSHGQPGALAGMVHDMAQTPQPHVLAGWVSSFGSFVAAHGFAVNLFAVIALAAIGAALLTGRPPLVRPALAVLIVFCLADWVLIEDFGVFGGVGTDPNSMIPLLLVAIGGYAALVRVPAAVTGPAQQPQPQAPPATAAAGPRRWVTAVSPRAVAAAGAIAIIAVGAVPMAAASANPNADPIIEQAIAGAAAPLNFPAPDFQLTDQHGRPVTLASLRGRAVLLTFLDPVCTTDCPLIAQEFRQAGQLLGRDAGRVALVAVVANRIYRGVMFTRAFDRQERLDTVPQWRYLTGTLAELQHVWRAYGITVETVPAGAMAAPNDIAFVIDPAGRVREELSTDPGPGTASSKSSFAVVLASAAKKALKSS